jgi:hypothetical protein
MKIPAFDSRFALISASAFVLLAWVSFWLLLSLDGTGAPVVSTVLLAILGTGNPVILVLSMVDHFPEPDRIAIPDWAFLLSFPISGVIWFFLLAAIPRLRRKKRD